MYGYYSEYYQRNQRLTQIAINQRNTHRKNVQTQTVKNILRKYPSKYNFDGMFLDLVALLEFATESEAKEAAVWILAEYAE